MLAHLLHRDRGVVPLNDFDCTNTLKMIERVWHRVRGVVPPYDTDPNEDAFSYNIALGGDPPRDVMVGWGGPRHRCALGRGGVSVWPDAVSVPILAQAARFLCS